MAKYHINPSTGNPGVCRADPSQPNSRGCDFDLGESEHYASAQEARSAYEAFMEAVTTAPVAKPVSKRVQRLQERAEVPTQQDFSRMTPFSSQEARSARDKLTEELGPGERGPWIRGGEKWVEYSDKVSKAAIREEELNKARYGAALLTHSASSAPMSAVVASGDLDESSPRQRLTDDEEWTVESLSRMPSKLQEAVYRQPPAFLRVLAETPPGDSNVRALAELSDELRSIDPSYAPSRGEIPPNRTSGYRSAEGVPQMQKMGPHGYGLLQSYAKAKFGDRSKEFWLTVESDSVNYPKVSDFMRAVKEFS